MRHFTVIYASLLSLLLIFGLLISEQSISGHVTASETKEQVRDFISKLPAAQVIDDANVCLIIPVTGGEASFDVKKSAGIVSLKDNCAVLNTYDIVVKFTSYNAFLKNYQDPTANVGKNHGTDYFLLPSRAVLTGGQFNCDPEFQEKYCVVPYLYYSAEELATVNNCCAEYELSASQRARLEQARPSGFFALLAANFVVLSLLFAVLVFIIVFSFVLTRRMKKGSKESEKMDELKSYAVDMISKGYNPGEIKKSLADAGWTLEQIEEAFK